MKILLVIFFSVLNLAQNFSQQENKSTEWFPAELNIQPFTANFLEPKAGFSYLLGRREIRLDVGTSQDIFRKTGEDNKLSFGADLFTYTRLRGGNEFHFPVEAIDYLFGINGSYKVFSGTAEYGVRLRLSHISAHFVDGHFDKRLGTWQDGRNPRTYSREFIEVFPYFKFRDLRIYGGFTYLLHVTPEKIGNDIYQLGFDYFAPYLFFNSVSPFIAYDFKLSHLIDNYSGNNIFTAGIKFGKYSSGGFSILISYFSGKSIHGEYYDLNENYTSLGFNIDL